MGPTQRCLSGDDVTVTVEPDSRPGTVVVSMRAGRVQVSGVFQADDLIADTAKVSGVALVVGVADLARMAELAPQTIRKYLSEGDLPRPVLRLGQSPAWSVASVRDWLRSRREGTPC